MVYDRIQAESILARAQELDAPTSDAAFDVEALTQLADELEVSRSALSQAIEEAAAGAAGSLTTSAGAVIDQPAAQVTKTLSTYLRLRGLTSTGWSVWEQASGWWPDVYRYRAQTPVVVSVAPAGDATRVRLTARLDRLARVHVLLALLAPLWVSFLAGRGATIAELMGWAVPAALWIVGSGLGFLYRREAIRRRLATALCAIAEPVYRAAPW